MKHLGLVGRPNAGRSSVVRARTGSGTAVAPGDRPGCLPATSSRTPEVADGDVMEIRFTV